MGAEECISVWKAPKAFNYNAAYQYGEEQLKGSTFTPGKYADFVMLGQNPLTAAPEKLRDIRVQRTVKQGKTVFESSNA